MSKQDKERLDYSKEMLNDLPVISKTCFSSMKWPHIFYQPMFEARTAFAVPNNYFQNLFIDDEKTSIHFSHGSMRSVFFFNTNLILFSKNVNFKDAKEYFTSFVLCHFTKGEYVLSLDSKNITIKADIEKPVLNLLTQKTQKRRISFNFIGSSVINKLITSEQVKSSEQFSKVYSRYLGGAGFKSASIDMEGYAITVPHFSPHPYLLQIHSQLGFASARDMQENVIDYFVSHSS